MSRRNAQLAAWVLTYVLFAILFWQQHHFTVQHDREARARTEQVDRSSRERDYQACLARNASRADFRLVARKLVDEDGVRSPGEQRAILLVNKTYRPVDCSKVKP